jgi:thiol-disulfide isomerase/thioredoxin
LLAQSVVAEYGGRVRFVSENYGESELAKRFGVTRYPAIFVDDVLAATPKDFGFYGKGEGAGDGRYSPLRSAASHDRFRADLSRIIGLSLRGRRDDARALGVTESDHGLASLPDLRLRDIDGRAVTSSALAGRVVLVEFWATWCPPCRSTLAWLGELKRRHGDAVEVVAISVESDSADVRRLAGELGIPVRWSIGSPEIARSFGDISAVPTLFLFDAKGATAGTFFGAPPELHSKVEAKIGELLRPS